MLPNRYFINYGENQEWTGRQCNFHQTGFVKPETTAQHDERSAGDTASLSMEIKPGQKGMNWADVGVQYTFKSFDWNAYKDAPIAITVTAKYMVAVHGGSPTTWALMGTAPTAYIDRISGQATHRKIIKQTFTQKWENERWAPLTVKDLVPNGASGNYDGNVHAGVVSQNLGTDFTTLQRTSGSVTVESIGIQFL
jgi:hypothetical protein